MKTRRNKPVTISDAPERHFIAPLEWRDDSADENVVKLSGYASTFEPYDMYGGPASGGWIEQIARGAFDKTLREKPDLHLLINHAGMPLARTKSGTLKLSVDDHGLRVDAELDRRDPEVQALEVKMRRGDMDEMSFAFRVKAQEWEATADFPDDDMALRTITEVSLHKGDVSVVNFGANPTTSASVRSVEEALKIIAECDESMLAEARSDEDLVRKAAEKLGANAQNVTQNFHISNLRSEINALELESSPDVRNAADVTHWLLAERGWKLDVREWLDAELRAWLTAEAEFRAAEEWLAAERAFVQSWLDAEQENLPKRGMSLRLAKALAGE